jgi:hypothetical protein
MLGVGLHCASGLIHSTRLAFLLTGEQVNAANLHVQDRCLLFGISDVPLPRLDR